MPPQSLENFTWVVQTIKQFANIRGAIGGTHYWDKNHCQMVGESTHRETLAFALIPLAVLQ